MSAKISYILEIQGLDANIAKLKVLDSLLNNINRKGGINGAGTNIINAGGGKGANTIPIGASGGAGALEGAAVGAGITSIATAFGKEGKKFVDALKDVSKANNPEARRKAEEAADASHWELVDKIERSKGKQYDTKEDFTEHVTKQVDLLRSKFSSGGSGGGYSGPVPPMNTWWNRLKGGFSSIEKSVGGKEIKELFSFAGMGKLGGEAAKLAGTFGRLGLIGIGVAAALIAFRIALKLAIEGIKIAAEAYQTAAKRAINVRSSQRINNAFGALGIQPPDLSKISTMLGRGNDANVILNAARTGQLGEEGQQLINMAEDFKRIMKDSQGAAVQIQQASRAGFELSMDAKQIGIEWKALLAQIAAESYQLLHPLLQLTKIILQLVNDLMYLHLLIFGLFPTSNNKDFQKTFFGNGNNIGNNTSLEKMGLIFGSAPSYGSMQQNIATIASNTSKLVGFASKGGNFGTGTELRPFPALP